MLVFCCVWSVCGSGCRRFCCDGCSVNLNKTTCFRHVCYACQTPFWESFICVVFRLNLLYSAPTALPCTRLSSGGAIKSHPCPSLLYHTTIYLNYLSVCLSLRALARALCMVTDTLCCQAVIRNLVYRFKQRLESAPNDIVKALLATSMKYKSRIRLFWNKLLYEVPWVTSQFV